MKNWNLIYLNPKNYIPEHLFGVNYACSVQVPIVSLQVVIILQCCKNKVSEAEVDSMTKLVECKLKPATPQPGICTPHRGWLCTRFSNAPIHVCRHSNIVRKAELAWFRKSRRKNQAKKPPRVRKNFPSSLDSSVPPPTYAFPALRALE